MERIKGMRKRRNGGEDKTRKGKEREKKLFDGKDYGTCKKQKEKEKIELEDEEEV